MTKFAAIQMTATNDVSQNLAKAQQFIAEAYAKGAKFVMLPEDFAFIGEKDTDKLSVAESFGHGILQETLAKLAKKHQIWLHCGSIPLKSEASADKVFNSSLVWDPNGDLVARYNKVHLFDVAIQNDAQHQYRESKVVAPGSEVVCVKTPVGTLGLSICYDLRFPELYRHLAFAGANVLLVPAAFTKTTGLAHWEVLLRSRAIENFCFVVAANQVGTHVNQKSSYGSSMIINPWGEVITRLSEGEGVIIAEVDLQEVDEYRQRIPALTHKRVNDASKMVLLSANK